MNPIKEIENRLQKYPDARFEIKGNTITVFAGDSNGFDVSLSENGSSYTVSFEGWHEEFEDSHVALECFAFGLSKECRLNITLRGRFAHEWTIETRDEDGGWAPCNWFGTNTTGVFVFPFWLRKAHVHRQNHWIVAQSQNP